MDGAPAYNGTWALDSAAEKGAFEGFVDFVMQRWRRSPDLHVYHFGAYEPSALKRLTGRYATRQEEIDQILRAGLLVDLYGVVRQSLQAGIERYSIGQHAKILEDKTGDWTLQDILLPHLQSRFKLSEQKVPNFGFTQSVYWAKLVIENHDSPIYNWLL